MTDNKKQPHGSSHKTEKKPEAPESNAPSPSTPAPTNSAVLREALEELVKFTCNSEDGQRVPILRSAIIRARNALAAPPRNCDVGTAEEQVARHYAFCAKMMKQNNHCCGPCPCHKFVNGEAQPCTLLWAQMPYKEGGAE